MIEVRCFHRLPEAQPFRNAINALNLASSRPDPFSTFDFYQNYLRNAELFQPAGSLRLWLLLAFSGDELIGYLALKHSTHSVFGLRAAKLDLLTSNMADRPHLVARPEHEAPVSAAIYAHLLERKKEWSLLEFQQQDAASPLLPPPAEAASGSCQFKQWPNMASGTIPVRWSSTAGYFAALSKKSRSNVSRQMRTLLAAGEVQVLTSSDPQSSAALFELYRSIEPHSWKGQADAAIGRYRQSVDYCTGLMDPAQPMRIAIQVLLLDGVPIAGLISGAFGRGLYALHIVYDDRLARLAPGSAILWMGMRLAIEGGYEFFNLLWGFGYYKTRWLAQMSETQSLQIYRIGTPFYWRRVLGDVQRRWFRKAVTDEAALFNPARREVDKAEPAQADAASTQLASPAQRERYAALTAQVRRGHGEFLLAAQLAAVMPFETQRPGTPGACAPSEQRVRDKLQMVVQLSGASWRKWRSALQHLRRTLYVALWAPLVKPVLGRVPLLRRIYNGWARAHPFDAAHGVDTSGFVPAVQCASAGVLAAQISPYGGSQPSIVRTVLASLPAPERYAFVDIGCGKGRPLIVAAEFPFRRLVGVELAPRLAQVARANAAIVAAQHPGRTPIEILVGDATAVSPPAERVVYFMYHAFNHALVRALVANLEQQLRNRLQHAFFVYYNPVHGEVLDQSPHFARWSAQTLPYAAEELGYGPDHQDTLVIWQSLPGAYPAQAGVERRVAVNRSQWCSLETPAC